MARGGEQDANSYDFGLLFGKLEDLIASDPATPVDELAQDRDLDQSGQTQGKIRSYDAEEGATEPGTGGNRKDYSFVARYGRVVLRRSSADIPGK